MAAVGTQLRSPSNGSGGVSRLALMQERMRENIRQEKESRMLEMVAKREAEREEIINRVTKSSSSSLSDSMSSLNFSGAGQGRVRKMLEERRTNTHGRSYHSSKGYDKSYPLDPVKRDGGRPPIKGANQNGRGFNMDRNIKKPDISSMTRSRSQVTLQRANRGNNRLSNSTKSFDGLKVTNYHKSASSLLDNNSRGPSPAPPSSSKSSPGSRGLPVNAPRKPPVAKIPPVLPRSTSNAPKPPPRKAIGSRLSTNSVTDSKPQTNGTASGGFLSKLGLTRSQPKANNTPAPRTPVPGTPKVTNVKAIESARKNDGMPSCKICGRTFASDRLSKHQEICSKSKAKAKKRKVFDPTKMRTQGTEAEKYIARGYHKKERPTKKADWRKKHDDLIQTLRAAKGVPGYVAPPVDTSDYVTCPHCNRKFNVAAADRHIPKCTSIQSNKIRR